MFFQILLSRPQLVKKHFWRMAKPAALTTAFSLSWGLRMRFLLLTNRDKHWFTIYVHYNQISLKVVVWLGEGLGKVNYLFILYLFSNAQRTKVLHAEQPWEAFPSRKESRSSCLQQEWAMLPQFFATGSLTPLVLHSTKHIISLASGA